MKSVDKKNADAEKLASARKSTWTGVADFASSKANPVLAHHQRSIDQPRRAATLESRASGFTTTGFWTRSKRGKSVMLSE